MFATTYAVYEERCAIFNIIMTSFVLYFSYENIHIIWFCCNWLAMSNSCYNPFVYGLLNVSHTKRKMPAETNIVIKRIICKPWFANLKLLSSEISVASFLWIIEHCCITSFILLIKRIAASKNNKKWNLKNILYRIYTNIYD